MWKDTHLVERDMEMHMEMERRMNSRLREAEEWRLARGARGSSQAPGWRPVNLLRFFAATLRVWLSGSPQPQEDCC